LSDAWKADLAFLDETHRRLLEAVRRALSGGSRDAAAHGKMLRLVEGVASHDVYHAGQIRLLIRLMSTAASPA